MTDSRPSEFRQREDASPKKSSEKESDATRTGQNAVSLSDATVPAESEPSEELLAYRAHLVESEKEAQADLDKTTLKLSGGALGISFAFLKNVVGAGPYELAICLPIAWSAWGLSMALVLLSFYASSHSLRQAISQVDEGTIHTEKPGGWYDSATKWLNGLAILFFFVGLSSMLSFVYSNLATAP